LTIQCAALLNGHVDPLAERVDVYRASDPGQPVTYGRGQTAEAEPAVPGWRVAVDWILG
jgi:hypothetical protein